MLRPSFANLLQTAKMASSRNSAHNNGPRAQNNRPWVKRVLWVSVKCLTHSLHGFNGAVQRRLATPTVTTLILSCWQLSSKVELRRIFDVCKQWANSGSHEFVKKNMVRYMRPHGRFAHCSCKNAALTLDLGLSASAARSCCIFTLAVRQPLVLASCVEIYYSSPRNRVKTGK